MQPRESLTPRLPVGPPRACTLSSAKCIQIVACVASDDDDVDDGDDDAATLSCTTLYYVSPRRALAVHTHTHTHTHTPHKLVRVFPICVACAPSACVFWLVCRFATSQAAVVAVDGFSATAAQLSVSSPGPALPEPGPVDRGRTTRLRPPTTNKKTVSAKYTSHDIF